jgi:cyclase
MERIMGKFAFGALWISLTLSAFGQQQTPDYDKVEIKLQKLSGNVYMLQGLGGNVVAYAGKDATVLVDCEEVELGPKIEAALKTISDKPVKYVLNTHWHGDHTGGNAYFGKTATIIAHDNVRKKMATEQDRRITNLAISLPLITFSDEITLHMDAGEIHAVHFAHGHSDGDSVVFYPEANVVQMGDDFTNFVPPHYPAIDTDNDGTGGPQGAIAAA